MGAATPSGCHIASQDHVEDSLVPVTRCRVLEREHQIIVSVAVKVSDRFPAKHGFDDIHGYAGGQRIDQRGFIGHVSCR